jgi:hypothetical protein
MADEEAGFRDEWERSPLGTANRFRYSVFPGKCDPVDEHALVASWPRRRNDLNRPVAADDNG